MTVAVVALAVAIVVGVAMLLAVRAVPRLRQRGYDAVAARERVRLVIALPAGEDPSPSVPAELVRALHPRQRRGVDRWRVGWPAYELRVVWRRGQLAWEIETGAQGAAIAAAALRALYPGVAIERSVERDPKHRRPSRSRDSPDRRAGRCAR